jgi:thymidylate synthase ThyX
MTISAKILCDSINTQGNRFTTFEVEFPRWILSEYNTHRQFSRNAASTRAIPILRQLELISSSPAMPSFYGKNQAGMSAKEGLDEVSKLKCISVIDEMREFCSAKVKELSEIGLHKQHAGRYIEAWQTVKGVVSSTEWDNWYWLRDDSAAQPEIAELARKMKEAYDDSVPQLLKAGEWHLPYVNSAALFNDTTQQSYIEYMIEDADGQGFYTTLEQAIKVSCARCAAVSYRNEDYGLEKCLELYERLVGSDKLHASSLEHCATPMMEYAERVTGFGREVTNLVTNPLTWQEGISHIDREGNLWSGNLKNWIQYRKTVKGECYSK